MFKNCSRYYYTVLNTEDKIVYKHILTELENRKKEITFKNSNRKSIHNIFETVLLDNPDLFYIDNSRIEYIILGKVLTLKVQYLYTDIEIEQGLKLIEKQLERFFSKYIKSEMNDYEKELAIHQYLSNAVTYNEEALSESDNRNNHNIVGGLIKKSCVCEGIAKSTKLLCDIAGLKSIVVFGDAKNIKTDKNTGHAWNIIKLDQECYHLDITWDITLKSPNANRYDYFNISDLDIGTDHHWDKRKLPPCKGKKYNYFNQNKFYIKQIEEMADIIVKQIKKGNKTIALKFLCELPTQQEVSHIINHIIAGQIFHALKHVYKNYTLGYNINQKIIFIDLI